MIYVSETWAPSAANQYDFAFNNSNHFTTSTHLTSDSISTVSQNTKGSLLSQLAVTSTDACKWAKTYMENPQRNPHDLNCAVYYYIFLLSFSIKCIYHFIDIVSWMWLLCPYLCIPAEPLHNHYTCMCVCVLQCLRYIVNLLSVTNLSIWIKRILQILNSL